VIVGNAIYVAGRRTEEFESLQEAYEAVRQRRGVAWIVLYKPTEEEFDSVAREFGLHPLPAEDPVKAPLRTRLERYGSTLFLVLKAARYLDETETVEFGEVDVSVGEGFVVTVLRGEPAALAAARELPEGQLELPGQGAAAILCAIVGRVVDGYDPVVAGLENDIDEIETEVFSGNAGVSRRIYELSREVIEFQKATGPLPDIIDRLTSSVEGPELPVCDGAHADGLSNAVRGIQAPRVALGAFHCFFFSDLSMCALTTLYRCVTLQRTCRLDGRGLLKEVSKTAQKKVSGLMLKISRLLAPPIHPRVSTVAVPSALRLISRAGRDGALRSA
jgi:hypothetical protein